MTLEIELQIKQRIKEIKRLLKSLPDEAALHYREILNDEITRLRKELAGITPLDNQSYLPEDEQSDAASDAEDTRLNKIDSFDSFYNEKND